MKRLTSTEMRKVQGGGGTCADCNNHYNGFLWWHRIWCSKYQGNRMMNDINKMLDK